MADQRATLDHELSTTGYAPLTIVQQADDGSVDEHQRQPTVRRAWFTKTEGADFSQKRIDAAAPGSADGCAGATLSLTVYSNRLFTVSIRGALGMLGLRVSFQ
jgi:hypothetical protein